MPRLPAPIFSDVYKNVDGVVLSDKSQVRYNAYTDELGGLNVRPGLVEKSNSTASRITGLFSYVNKYYSRREIISIQSSVLTVYVGTEGNLPLTSIVSFDPVAEPIKSIQRVIFCTDGDSVYFAYGTRIQSINLSSYVVTELADLDAPAFVTHVAYLDGYILANLLGSHTFQWSEILAPGTWVGYLARSAGSPDFTGALHVLQRQIYLIGDSSTEIWENDGDSPFSRIPGGYIEVGCIAVYSVVALDESLIWLSDKGYFVEARSSNIKKISGRYDKDIASFDNKRDCLGGRIDKDGRTYCIFEFASAGRTLVYEPSTELWTEWTVFVDGVNQPFRYTNSVFDTGTQNTYVSTALGVIGILDNQARTERTSSTEATTPIRFSTLTGWIDYGTNYNKRSNKLILRIKRGGIINANTSPTLALRWRSDGNLEWEQEELISLGNIGETEFVVTIERAGIFRTRQYEFYATDAVEIVMASAEEDFEVLSR